VVGLTLIQRAIRYRLGRPMTNRMPLVLRIGVVLGLIFGLGFAASSAGASGAAGTNEVVS
jgi:hypothetical protein